MKLSYQKGFSPILIVILIVLGVGGYLLYVNYSNDRTKNTSISTTNIVPIATNSGETVKWKDLNVIAPDGFGYEIEVPSSWDYEQSAATEGEKDSPRELARVFFDKNCSANKGRIMILHFLSANPQTDIEDWVNSLKKQKFIESTIQSKAGFNIEKLTGNIIGTTDYYAFISSSKGYYYISGRDECVTNYKQTFDQILSSLKLKN